MAMEFSQQLDQLMDMVKCSANQLAEASGTSPSTISRYHSGKRQPKPGSRQLEQLVTGIATIAAQKGLAHPSAAEARSLLCEALEHSHLPSFEVNAANLNALIELLGANATELARNLNYDASTLSRIRSGKRRPASPASFAAAMAELALRYCSADERRQHLAALLGDQALAQDGSALREELEAWLLQPAPSSEEQVREFLSGLDEFDFDDYVKKIGYDTLKVPQVPFKLASSKTFCGAEGRKRAGIEFLKTLATGKSPQTFTMFCNMGMDELAQDEAFTKQFLFGMAATLKRGVRIEAVHTVDRPLSELIAGLQGWIPLYMTGQVSSRCFEGSTAPFQHMLYSSEAVALQGRCAADDLGSALFSLTTRSEEVAALARQAHALLKASKPLVEAFPAGRAAEFQEEQSRLLESGEPVYQLTQAKGMPFKNIQVTVVGDEAALISKSKNPRIDFILRDERLCQALRSMALEGEGGSIWG